MGQLLNLVRGLQLDRPEQWLPGGSEFAGPVPPPAPDFVSTNEIDAAGRPVVAGRAPTIGPARIGDRYVPPSWGEIMTSANPLMGIAEHVIGAARPASVAAQDPYGILAWEQGAGPLPGFLGTTEEVSAIAARFPRFTEALTGKRLGSLARTIRPTEATGVYALRDPAVERVRDLYQIGTALPSTSNWAGAASEELLRAFGGDREAALRWARMWGATSPNTSVPVNTRESVSALIYALEHPGEAFTVPLAQTLPEAKITMAPSKVPNLNRALAGEPLSGDKVEAMAGFMTGEPRIPLDVHALYAVGSKADKLGPELSALRALMTKAEGLPLRKGLTDTELYLRYEDALRRTLQEFEPKRSVNQVFAELWEGARAHKGLKPQGGPIDILRKKGLLELGAMLDPERLRAALRQSGWTAGAIAGLLTALGADAPADEARP